MLIDASEILDSFLERGVTQLAQVVTNVLFFFDT